MMLTRKEKLVMTLIGLIALGMIAYGLTGCATINFKPYTPQRAYADAQTAYLNSWTSYHKVWLALPETDPRKKAWVKDYHPEFQKAGELLQTWASSPGSYDSSADAAIALVEDLIIKLAIKK